MAVLASTNGQMQLTLRLVGKSLDPFQADLEWFEYELKVEARVAKEAGPRPARRPEALGRRAEPAAPVARGKINRKELNELLVQLDALVAEGSPLYFEPFDLNFYLEWTQETPLVFLVITWFDLGLAPRTLEQRFPMAHAGVRFLADEGALRAFRRALGQEFAPGVAAKRPPTIQ